MTWSLLILQILLGGWTSTNYTSLACTDFPKCLNQWYPKEMIFDGAFNLLNLPDINYEGGFLVYGSKVAVHYVHRVTALVLTIFFILTIFATFKLKEHLFLKE